MSKKRILIFTALLAAVGIGVVLMFARPYIQIIGSLPAKDIREIRELVWHEVRRTELPKAEWDNVHHLGYVTASLRRYEGLRILWIDVKDEGYVRVVVGLSRKTIASDGWDFMVRKNSKWEIAGSAYWGIPAAAPKDFRFPSER